ncbi:MAG: VWA domain-containing protein [Lachnospiraceae bacterium]|nr:VWA domain-containing protein [Lachnospiraceae bacterium]
MAKFCSKCGTKLDETTGLCPNCDKKKRKKKDDIGTDPNQTLTKKELKKRKKKEKKQGKKLRKKEKRMKMTKGQRVRSAILKFVLFLILFIVVAGGVLGALTYFDIVDVPYISKILDDFGMKKQNEEFNLGYSQFMNISGTSITRKIDSEEDALAAIDELSEILGVDNVSEEFGECKTDTVLNNSFYRFEQRYKGVSVYGRSMIVSADSDGNCLMVTGNYSALGDLDTKIKYDEEFANKLIQDNYGEDVKIYNNGLTIYSLNNVTPEQTWNYYVGTSELTKNIFISTSSGRVIAEHSLTYTENVECSGKDLNNKKRTFNAEKKDNVYIMHDVNRGINIYDANNSTLLKECIVTDSNGKTYRIDDEKWVDESGNIVNIEGQNFSLVITDESGTKIGENGEYGVELKTLNIFTKVDPVTSKKSTWSNKKAVTLMAEVSAIYDFWKDNFNRPSFDGKHGEIAVIYDDFKNLGKEKLYLKGDTTNAESWGGHGLPITVLSFGTDNSLSVDVVGHEFAHSVERSISNMVYEGESGALMEAYSDIFGEISQDWMDDRTLNNSCDWIFDANRNMIDPSLISYPDTYKGENWADTLDEKADYGGVHTNNTVISHAAYLMTTGIGGNPNFEALSTDELAKLFYLTLFSIPSDCTFSQFRYVLQNTANILYKQGILSDKQRWCVSNAMFQVGIDPEPMTYAVSGDFELCVYDIGNKLYDDYSLSISELDLANMPQGPGIEPARKPSKTYQVQNSEPFEMSLSPGIYEIILSDNKNDMDKYRFNVITTSTGKNVVSINTGFGAFLETNASDTTDTPDIPSDAVEFNGHYYYLYDSGTASSYEEALQYCQDKGGYLATLTSQEENDFVYAYLGYKNCANVYFGLSDAANEGTWEWCTGEEVFYTNWNSGEPNDENPEEDYGEFYFKYPDGKWNDGDFGNSTAGDTNAFLCEWGDYTVQQTGGSGGQKTTSDERDVVLVLDASGSMAGTPLEETKKASSKFINTVLEQDASIGIVTYDEIANRVSEFSMNQTALQNAVSEVGDGGGTNIEAGLYEARSMLQTSNAKKKIIVLMSDGEPNNGKVGEDLIAYADEIKKEEILIYTIGFFESLTEKSDAQRLMEQLASDGCHYEVAKADDLVFFFEDMADQINGQKYIYVRIACPVDVSVTYSGQTLSSSDRDSNFRTDFGTLTFEEKEVDSSEEAEEDYEETGEIDDRIKVLRLKEGVDYDLKLTGTGRGVMNYTIGFMDEDGNYSDLRKFKNIRVSRRTTIDTVAAVSPESILNIDEDGDGKYDIKMRAEENGYGEEIKTPAWVIYAMCVAGILIVIDIFIIVILRATKKRKVRR